MSAGTCSPAGRRLTALLLPYAEPALPVRRGFTGAAEAFRFTDALPAPVRRAMAEVPTVAGSRPNEQPPGSWLLEVAENFGGRLCGDVNAVYGALRVDAVCFPAAGARAVAKLLTEAWPGQDETAVAEGWSGWDASVPLWVGIGRDLLKPIGRSVKVVSIWWD